MNLDIRTFFVKLALCTQIACFGQFTWAPSNTHKIFSLFKSMPPRARMRCCILRFSILQQQQASMYSKKMSQRSCWNNIINYTLSARLLKKKVFMTCLCEIAYRWNSGLRWSCFHNRRVALGNICMQTAAILRQDLPFYNLISSLCNGSPASKL